MTEALGKLTRDDEISNSMLAAAMGLSKWQTPNEVLKGCHRARNGENIRSGTTGIQQVGNYLEKPLINLAKDRVGLLEMFDEINKPVRHKNIPLNGSLDGIAVADNILVKPDVDKGFYLPEDREILLNGKGVVEIKVTSVFPEDVPVDYRGVIQLKASMACTEFDWGMLCILYGTDYRIFFYKRDVAWEESVLIPFVLDFDRRIENCEYYDPFNTNDAKGMYLLDDETVVELPESAKELIELIQVSEKNIKSIEETVDQSKTALMNMMKSAAVGLVDDYQVNWKTVNVKAKEEHTKIVPAKEASTYRRFSIRKQRKKS